MCFYILGNILEPKLLHIFDGNDFAPFSINLDSANLSVSVIASNSVSLLIYYSRNKKQRVLFHDKGLDFIKCDVHN